MTVTVHLVDGPFVSTDAGRRDVPDGGKRLLAFLALHQGRLERRYVAGSLWPECDEERAAGNLRSALWRLRKAGIDVVVAERSILRLDDDVQVDVDEMLDWASRVLSGTPTCRDITAVAHRVRALEILPDTHDDWATIERERIRQRVLHALEEASAVLAGRGRFGESVEAALTAVAADPLRESAQCALIRAHLAEHNVVEARRVFLAYARLLRQEVGVRPSTVLCELVGAHPCGGDADPRIGRVGAAATA